MKQEIDLLIRDGKLYDGTGSDPFHASIGITENQIAFVSTQTDVQAKKTIDAAGFSVAPGFIDAHAHSEFTLLADPRAEGKILQGVTSEINGNCGLSAAPLFGKAAEHREKDLSELNIKERWSSFSEYLDILASKRLAINFATLAGHGNIRASVIGYEDRKPKSDEIEKMALLLSEAVKEGALGLSTGLIYPPGVYAETEELISLCKHIPNLLYTSHMRSEGDRLIESIDEVLRIGREAGIAVHISHLKTGGKENWHKIDSAVSHIENARVEGLRITADRYPYTAASTDLDAVLPSWTYAGGADEELRRITEGDTRTRIRAEILSHFPKNGYWEYIVVSSVQKGKNAWMEGCTIADIAGKIGKAPVDALLDILIDEKLRVGAIFHSMHEANLRRFLALSNMMIGSDSSARSLDGITRQGRPHPRGFGSFPRFLGRYARDEGLVSITEAIYKMTMLPAIAFGLKKRGQIREGFAADIVVFDEKRIIDKATFTEPFTVPDGIVHVIINGASVVWEGTTTGALPGRVLRHGA